MRAVDSQELVRRSAIHVGWIRHGTFGRGRPKLPPEGVDIALEPQEHRRLGERLYKSLVGPLNQAEPGVILELLRDASNRVADHKFGAPFLWSEWDDVVDAWQLETWEAYRDVEGRRHTISVFNGSEPEIQVLADEQTDLCCWRMRRRER